jgi:hypothetical protein
VSAKAGSGPLRIVEHQDGTLLRLQTREIYALDAAVDLFGTAGSGAQRGSGRHWLEAGLRTRGGYAGPNSAGNLEEELTTDGNEIVMRRVAGSSHEFEELCDFIREHESPS